MKLNPAGVAVARVCSFANWFLAIFSAGFLPIISASTAVDSRTGTKELTPTENWVVAQLVAGRWADLTRVSADKRLSRAFLEHLLIGELPGFKLYGNSVIIFGAIIDEQIILPDARIPFAVELDDCQFNNMVIFDNANFTGGLSLIGSRFKDAANFHA